MQIYKCVEMKVCGHFLERLNRLKRRPSSKRRFCENLTFLEEFFFNQLGDLVKFIRTR